MKLTYKLISKIHISGENTKEPEYIKVGVEIDTSNILMYIGE